MAQLIDSSVFIGLERRRVSPDEFFSAYRDDVALAAVTASELLVGVYRAGAPEQRVRREAAVEDVLAAFPVLSFDLNAARVHARLAAEMSASGQLIGSHDLLIAATALANGYDVLTTNVRDFSRVPGLVVREPDW